MDELIIHSKLRDFNVKFVEDFSFVNKLLKIPHYLIVVGSVVYKLYKKNIFDKFPKDKVLVLKLDEQRKTLATVNKIYQKLLIQNAKKNIVLVSFGGGINQDISGFTASTIYRGINWIYIPTTLLAMADSAIGLKTSLNLKNYKNIIGGFYPPSEIYISVDFLDTLKSKDYYSGVGEIIKMLLMQKNASGKLPQIINLINLLKKRGNKRFILETIKSCMRIKKNYMKGDEFDTGRRNLLNYGHELGHALEATSHYRIPHGIGIVIGMIFANLVSYQRKWISKTTFELINNQLLLPNIKLVKLRNVYFNQEVLLNKLKRDKKRVSDKLPLILPKNQKFELTKITDFSFAEFTDNLVKLVYLLKPYLV